jgi:hypothetical protein
MAAPGAGLCQCQTSPGARVSGTMHSEQAELTKMGWARRQSKKAS